MNKAKAVLGLVVLAGGLIVGTFGAQLANPAPPASPWRALPTVEEPSTTAGLTSLLLLDDAKGLAKALDAQLLQRLSRAIDPLVDVDEVTFAGATERQGDILSAYAAGGRSQSGDRIVVGVVFRVRDGKVVGVN